MTAGSAATDLARLRVRHGALWRIDRQPGPQVESASGPGWIAPPLFVAVHRNTGLTLTDSSPAGLAAKITREETMK